MNNVAATPCINCIHSNNGKWCKFKLHTVLNEAQDKIIAPGFCRSFSQTQIARTPYGITVVIYFDKGNLLSDLIKTLTNLRIQNKSCQAHALDEPFDQIKQYVIIDNTLEHNKDLFDILRALVLGCEIRLEQEFEHISFEKAIHYGITRYAKFDYTLALKTESTFGDLWGICDFDITDRFVFIDLDDSQGLYLNQAFKQLGGGECFLQRLSNFDNYHEDLVVKCQDFINKRWLNSKEAIDDIYKILEVE